MMRVDSYPGDQPAMSLQTRRPKATRALPKRRPTSAAAPENIQRSPRGAATRARLVKAAKEIFERDGFLEARISDIAKRAKVSYGAFYHYFDSKEEVFREVAEAQEDRLTAPPDEGSEPSWRDLSPEERIHRANRRYLERYKKEARIMGVIEEVSRYDPYVNAARMASMKHFVERSERAILRLQTEGKADPRLNPALASDALGAMVARFAELWLTQGYRKYDFEEAVDQLSRLWANAIGLNRQIDGRQTRKRKSIR
jgi:AcrR family transcriptional regulator